MDKKAVRKSLEKVARAIDLDLEDMSKRLKDDWQDFWDPYTDRGCLFNVAEKLCMNIDFNRRVASCPLPDGTEATCSWGNNGLDVSGAVLKVAETYADWV